MRKASIVVSPYYCRNKLFDIGDRAVNRDNCLYPWFVLKNEMAKRDFDLSTQDINPVQDSDLVIFSDMPKVMPNEDILAKSALLLLENEVIRPDNWVMENVRCFRWVFTWNDDLIDGRKFFKIQYAQKIPHTLTETPFEERKLCTLIAGYKKSKHPLNLYSERLAAIHWFEQNHPEDFDFYGIGWDKPFFFNRYAAYATRKLPACVWVFHWKFPSWRGAVNSKNETLSRYRFAICYENARDITGYITEKIFDCLFAGCVPVYWGAPNIAKFMPQECFIDRRDFDSYENIYRYLASMKKSEWEMYLKGIKKFLTSDAIKAFSPEAFCTTIIQTMLI
jgi:hypothetical protein